MTPTTTQRPQTPRGAIRLRQEAMLAAASKAGKFQTIIVRAGDFYAPHNRGDWFDLAMLMDVKKGKIHHMADLDISHAWAYLPDLGRAFVALAERRDGLAAYENFHFAGHFVTNGQMMDAISKAWGSPLKISPMPWLVIQAMGLVNAMMRETVKMRYLWNNPMELVDPRLDAILGSDFATSFEDAVAATVAPFRTSRIAA